MLTYAVLIHSDPNNINTIVYHLLILRYSMKTLHWYFPWVTALHLYNMTGRGEKLQQLHCYHPFSDSLDIDLTKNHYENYSPKMVPIAKIWGSGSWTNGIYCLIQIKAYSRFAPSQWQTALLCNDVCHWLGANLESALHMLMITCTYSVSNWSIVFLAD